MNKEQAWQLVMNMYQKFVGTASDHDLLAKALNVLNEELFPKAVPPPPPPMDEK